MGMFDGTRVAIANRAEIAIRIATTCRRLGAVPIALLGDPDLDGMAARRIGLVEPIGPAGSEFDPELVVAAARRAGATYLHPGYGFLSERADLAELCARSGLRFVGPSPETLRLCGDKLATRREAARAGVSVLPASDALGDDPQAWYEEARLVGFPLLVKPSAAGGGRGLRRVTDEHGLVEAIRSSRRESASSGAGDEIYLEREFAECRHVEVQVAADGVHAIALGDRDCSIQRRHQKVIEEAPAPHVPPAVRAMLHDFATRIARVTGLQGIATCEFLLGVDGTIAFLEVNPRIQVEHPVTELVTGIDLVALQLHLAAGGELPIAETPEPRGHAIEARVYAEDPGKGFLPGTGKFVTASWPTGPGIRVDAGYERGDTITSAYDPLIAKIIVHDADRDSALATLDVALRSTVVAGPVTNIPWLCDLLKHPRIRSGTATTATEGELAPSVPDRTPALLAAVAHLLAQSDVVTRDPWTAIGPWRQSGRAPLTFHGSDWEETVELVSSDLGWAALLHGQTIPFRWMSDADGVLTISTPQTGYRLSVVDRGSHLEVMGEGGRWGLRRGPTAISAGGDRTRIHDGRVRSPFPARVLAIHVVPGETVSAGQALVTLSAMKIELVCDAPVSGLVESVSCEVDAVIDAEQVMITILADRRVKEAESTAAGG